MQDRSEEPCISFVRELLLSRYPYMQVQFSSQDTASLLVPDDSFWCKICVKHYMPNLEGRFSKKLGMSNSTSLRNCRPCTPVKTSDTLAVCSKSTTPVVGISLLPSSVGLYVVNRSTAAALAQQAVRTTRTLGIRRHGCAPINRGLLSPGPRFRR